MEFCWIGRRVTLYGAILGANGLRYLLPLFQPAFFFIQREWPCLFFEHDGDAVAYRISEITGETDQFVFFNVVFQFAFAHRTHKQFEQFFIEHYFT